MTRRLALLTAVLVGLGIWLAPPALAGKSCAGCAPTVVVLNGAGSVTVSTTATPNGGCLGAVSPTKYACNIRVVSATGGASTYSTTGEPTVLDLSAAGCPCTAQFWVHAGQWQPFSAVSDPFTP